LIFPHPNFEILKCDLPGLQNSWTFLGDEGDIREQLSFWDHLPNPSGFGIKNLGNNSNLNLI
jgi:hypothetical protein